MSARRSVWVIAPIAVGLLTPSAVIFGLATTVGRMAVADTLKDLTRRQFASGENLFLVAILGLLPFVILSGLLLLISRNEANEVRVPVLSAWGMVGTLLLMVPAHVNVWLPLYLGTHVSSTAVIAFLFIPVYSSLTMALGLGVGLFLSRRRIDRAAAG